MARATRSAEIQQVDIRCPGQYAFFRHMSDPATNAHPASMTDLSGKRAFVTGGSRGIGAAIARRLAEAGADVAINYHRESEKAESVAQAVRALGRRALTVAGDVSNPDSVAAMFRQIAGEWGTLDILVNNAGWEDIHHAIELPAESFNRAMGINLGGIFFCSQQAARLMEKSGGGAIINNLSIHDEVPRKGLAHYCAAKAGAKMLTQCLALEWAELGIRVNAVSPGAIETDMNREEIESFGRQLFNRAIPAGRVGNVDEIASIVLFLAGHGSSYITGTTVYADGGYRLTTIPYDPRPPRNP